MLRRFTVACSAIAVIGQCTFYSADVRYLETCPTVTLGQLPPPMIPESSHPNDCCTSIARSRLLTTKQPFAM